MIPQVLLLDKLPAYVPFDVQCTKADGEKADPSAANLIVYEEGGADGTFDTAQISSSPFTPVKVNSKTGQYGVLINKSELTAGKVYRFLWELTVDSKTTAKVESFLALNAFDFMADVSSLATQSSVNTIDGIVDDIVADTNELQTLIADSKLPAQVKGIDDINFPATQLASIITKVTEALNTAKPGSITTNSLYNLVELANAALNAVKGGAFESANDNLHALRGRIDDTWGSSSLSNLDGLTPEAIRAEIEEAGSKLDAIFTNVNIYLDKKISSRASLGSGNTEYPYKVVYSGTSNPIANVLVEVRATNDVTADVVAWGYTNDLGDIKFYLNKGQTYYFWHKKANTTFTNPEEVTVG